MKVLFLINDLNFFYSHRLPIALELKSKGFDVLIIYGDKGNINPQLKEKHGFKTFFIPIERSGMNALKDLIAVFKIYKLFISIKPDIVHLVTIKPYLYGGVISRLARVPSIVSAVSGLGTLFINQNIKSRILRFILYPIYRFAFNHPNQTVIVQNSEDADLLVRWGVLNKDKIHLINGSGVDLNIFTELEELDSTPVVCFLARLLADKGVHEFLSAARILKTKGIKAKFYLAGDIDFKNKTGLQQNQLDKIKSDNYVEVLGYQKDVPKLYAQSHIICLPSYREGLPKSLVEAAAAGRAVVTTDVPGCRDAIEPGITGLLVPVKDEKALAEAINFLIMHPGTRKKMGKAGRELAERKFRIENIVDAHFLIYEKLIAQSKILKN